MGVACSLLVTAIVCSWAVEGKVGIRVSSFGSEATTELRRAQSPIQFWSLIGALLAASLGSLVITGAGFKRVRRDEDRSSLNQSPQPTPPEGG